MTPVRVFRAFAVTLPTGGVTVTLPGVLVVAVAVLDTSAYGGMTVTVVVVPAVGADADSVLTPPSATTVLGCARGVGAVELADAVLGRAEIVAERLGDTPTVLTAAVGVLAVTPLGVDAGFRALAVIAAATAFEMMADVAAASNAAVDADA